MKASDIRDELKHIRLIHFTVTTVSGLMLYLIIAAWSVPPALYPELLDLKDYLGRLQAGEAQLWEINPREAAGAEDRLLRRLQTLINPTLQWDRRLPGPYRPPFRCMQPEEEHLPTGSLSERINRVKPCKLMMPEQIEGDVGNVQAWIQDRMRPKMYTVDVGPYLSDFMWAPDAQPGPGNTGEITLKIAHAVITGAEGGDGYQLESDAEQAIL